MPGAPPARGCRSGKTQMTADSFDVNYEVQPNLCASLPRDLPFFDSTAVSANRAILSPPDLIHPIARRGGSC